MEAEFLESIAPWVAIVISIISLGTTLYMYYGKLRYDKDKELTALVSQSLKNAYEILTEGEECIPPKPVRMNWLASARSVMQGEELERRVRTKCYKESCLVIREVWRLRFYKVLNVRNVFDPSAYKPVEKSEQIGVLPCSSALGLEPRSIAILYDFAINGMSEDVIDAVDLKELVDHGDILSGNYGLKQYFNQSAEYKAIINKQQEEKELREKRNHDFLRWVLN